MVFFIDEFQELINIDDSKPIESAIRQVAQSTKYLTFIFAGSNRKLINFVFEDSSRPLYLLCEEVLLERIQPNYFCGRVSGTHSYTIRTRRISDAGRVRGFDSVRNDAVVAPLSEIRSNHPATHPSSKFRLISRREDNNLNKAISSSLQAHFMIQRAKPIRDPEGY